MLISEYIEKNIMEDLAEVEHSRWASWQQYVHDMCTSNPDGSLTIPKELVTRWDRQIKTTYSDLSEREKDSDRDQVKKYIQGIKKSGKDIRVL